MVIRKALAKDLQAVASVYADVHTAEENGDLFIGWNRSVYPTIETARLSLERDDLFVLENTGEIVGAAIINQQQMDVYADANWIYQANDNEVMVLHTLVISPKAAGRGFGTSFVKFYEAYALEHNCPVLRIDTNEINHIARAIYHKLGYREACIVPCVFNGLKDVNLVLLEKKLI